MLLSHSPLYLGSIGLRHPWLPLFIAFGLGVGVGDCLGLDPPILLAGFAAGWLVVGFLVV